MRGIITYHSIDESGSVISTSRATFRRQVEWIARSGIPVVPLARLTEGGEDPALALTFDDGFRSFEESAAPVLVDLGLPATVFVVSAFAGGVNRWPGTRPSSAIPELSLLDWAGVERVQRMGFEVGSHSRTHRSLTRLSPRELEEEVQGSAAELGRHLGGPPRSFAYPFGAWNERTRRAVSRVYATAVTTELRPLSDTEDLAALPRIDAWYLRRPGRLESWGQSGFSRYLLVRRIGRAVRATVSSSVRRFEG